jgi:hypothetical protein
MPRTVDPFEPDPQDERSPIDDACAHSQQQHLLGRAPPQSFDVQPTIIRQVPRILPQYRSVFNYPFSKCLKDLRFEPIILSG